MLMRHANAGAMTSDTLICRKRQRSILRTGCFGNDLEDLGGKDLGRKSRVRDMLRHVCSARGACIRNADLHTNTICLKLFNNVSLTA